MTLGRRHAGAFLVTRGSGLNTVFYYRVTVKYVMYVNPSGIAKRSGEPGLQGKGRKKDGKMALRGKKGEGVRRRNEKKNRLKADGGGEVEEGRGAGRVRGDRI